MRGGNRARRYSHFAVYFIGRAPVARLIPFSMDEHLHHGSWTHDSANLPCFDGQFIGPVAVERPFLHGISSGRLNALINRWGLVHLFTTEAGYLDLSLNNSRVRSGLYLELEFDGQRTSLIHGDLPEPLQVRYGIGYAQFTAHWRQNQSALEITQEFSTPPDRASRLVGCFHLRNLGSGTFVGTLRVRSDVEIAGQMEPGRRALDAGPGYCRWTDAHRELGDLYLAADDRFHGQVEEGVALGLAHEFRLRPGETISFNAQIGYGRGPVPAIPAMAATRQAWAQRLERVAFTDLEPWIRDEAIWCAGQLCSFEAYDRSVGEHYLNLGGYGWAGFGAREVPQTALTVAAWEPALAFSCLRWTAKIQYSNGDIPHCHAFRRPGPGERLSTGRRESDNELWFVLACADVVATTGRIGFLDEEIPFWEGERASLWEHLRRAIAWIRDGIGVGRHGLIRMAEGDWNDYLSHVGAGGQGESMMNTGMACRALAALLPFAEERDPGFASDCRSWLAELRAAATAGFDERWFVRGHRDDGRPFGTSVEDRVFLNAQSWCVLGGCGTQAMREAAMRAVLEKCHSPLGLTLMSRPYSCPPPADISRCPIPPGDGENAGIWPQTVHWAIWALADLGWRDEALDLWKRASLRNHSRLHPEVPYGIFNGPDCYSSHFSVGREGWSQVQMLDRSRFPPMNPMIAWSSFSLDRIFRPARIESTVSIS